MASLPQVLFADGTDATVTLRNVRARVGDSHPVTLAMEELERRMERYTGYSAILVQARGAHG